MNRFRVGHEVFISSCVRRARNLRKFASVDRLKPAPRYNRPMRRTILLLACAASMLAQKRPFDVNALMELKRLGDPQISPDGRWVTFGVQSVDVAASKKP